MSRSPSRSPCAQDGFTLVEALAALAITAVSIAAIGQLSNVGLRTGLSVERHLAEVETARKIIAGMPSRPELPDGTLAGSLDSHDWRLQAEPYANDLVANAGAASWRPQRIVLRVKGPDGGLMDVFMVRLRKQAGR